LTVVTEQRAIILFKLKKEAREAIIHRKLSGNEKKSLFQLKLFFSYSCVLSGVPDALHRGEISRFGEDAVLAKPLQQRGVQPGLRFPFSAADVGRTTVLPPEVVGRAAARAAAAVPRFRRSAAGGHIFCRVQKDLEEEKIQIVTYFSNMTKNTHKIMLKIVLQISGTRARIKKYIIGLIV
jgi:hypothetical protein